MAKHSRIIITFFGHSDVSTDNFPLHKAPKLDLVEVVLVIFMLLLWSVVIKIFLLRWGRTHCNLLEIFIPFFLEKLSRLLPYQPVYSKEMAEKIEMEEEKIRLSRECSISSQVGTSNITSQGEKKFTPNLYSGISVVLTALEFRMHNISLNKIMKKNYAY